MNKYARSITALLAVSSLTLAGTQMPSVSHAAGGTKPPTLKKGVTLKIWDYFGTEKNNPERATEMKIIQQWEKKTGDKVETPTHPNNSNTLMCQAAPSGQGPDLIAVPHDQMGGLVACKAVSPIPTWAWPASEQKQYIKAGVTADKIGGKEWAMPWAIETTGIFYNKKLISPKFFAPVKIKTKHGTKSIPVPWSKVIAKAKSMTNLAAKKYALGWDINNFYYDYAFVSGGGGYVFKSGKKGLNWHQIGLATPGAVKGLAFMRNLFDFGKYKIVPSTMTYDIAKSGFDNGTIPMFITGPWDEPSFQQAGVNFGFAPWPSFGTKPSHPFSGLQMYAVNAYSPHKNEAFALMNYLTRHMQLPEFKTSGRIPVIKSLLNSKTVKHNSVARGLAQAALTAQPMPSIAEMNSVWTPMGTALGLINTNKATPAAAARAAVQQIQQAIAKSQSG